MGRGRPTGIEMLPEACSPLIIWAAGELQNRNRSQTDIYREFCERLLALNDEYDGSLGIITPSFSAFNRYSIRLAVMTRRLNETREIAQVLAEKFDVKASDNVTVMAAEAIKNLIVELLGGDVDAKGLQALSNALRAANQAQGVSTARRQKVEADFAAKADAAIEAVAKAKGMTKETVDDIKARILGIKHD